jgi:hypothetical protein
MLVLKSGIFRSIPSREASDIPTPRGHPIAQTFPALAYQAKP